MAHRRGRYEVEVKAPAPEPGRVTRFIIREGGKFVVEVEERDIYFAHPVRDFAATDEAFRVREVKRLRGRPGTVYPVNTYITYKGPKIDPLSKTREEINLDIGEAKTARDIFERLGFRPVQEVRKRRTVYRLGPFIASVDTLDQLGTFVELEGVGDEIEPLRDAALALVKRMGLERTERRSYLELVLAAKRGE